MLSQVFCSMKNNRPGLRLIREEKGKFFAENGLFTLNNYYCLTSCKTILTGRIPFSQFRVSIGRYLYIYVPI